MNLSWIFLVVVALLIGWFVLDRPVEPGETLAATIESVKPINVPSGPPSVEVFAKLPDGTTAIIKVEHPGALQAGNKVQIRKLTRRISGAASYELIR